MSSIREEPIDQEEPVEREEPVELEEPTDVISEPVEAVEVESVVPEEAAPKAKAKMGRPVGKKDTKQRAKPKPKAKIVAAPVYESESSEEDEATLQELHALRMMRSIRAYDNSRQERKVQRYASWFGR